VRRTLGRTLVALDKEKKMLSQRFRTKWLVVAGVAAVVAAVIAPAAAAKPTIEPDGWAYQYAGPVSSADTNAWADQIVDPYGTVALREQRAVDTNAWADQVVDPYGTVALRAESARGEFIPGVTDSTTGVLRELERKGLEPRVVPSTTSADDSGFRYDDAAIGMSAVLAVALLMAATALVASNRRRRPAV
jgi:hypothetical protein